MSIASCSRKSLTQAPQSVTDCPLLNTSHLSLVNKTPLFSTSLHKHHPPSSPPTTQRPIHKNPRSLPKMSSTDNRTLAQAQAQEHVDVPLSLAELHCYTETNGVI